MPFSPSFRQEHRAEGHRHPHANGGDRRFDVLHGVVNRQPRRHESSRRINIHLDLFAGIDRIEIQERRDDDIGRIGGHRALFISDEKHAFLKELRVQIVALSRSRLIRMLNDCRD